MSIDVDKVWEGGETTPLIDSIVGATYLTLNFLLLIGKADELLVSSDSLSTSVVSRGSFWEHERQRALRQMMHTPCTVSVHMDDHNWPYQSEARGFVVSEQVLEAVSRRRGET